MRKKLLILFLICCSIMITSCKDNSNKERTFEVGYNIFPIAFSDSNGDGLGDINGITNKLDYLQELGIDTIWLNPIHESNTYHKYDVLDYYSIDDDFGTMEDFELLIEEAHKRNINVLIDLVINHTSSQHPWFKSAISDENSEYRDYYRFYDFSEGLTTYASKDGWAKLEGEIYYFASFWSEMPELNFENEKVTEEVYNIADFWLDKGVDGFRIDAVKHLYDQREYPKGTATQKLNFEWFIDFKEHVESVNPNAFIIGEVYQEYQSVSPYYQGFDSLFNFTVGEKIVTTVSSELNTDFNKMVEKSVSSMEKYSDEGVQGYFITNHDQDRVMSRLGGDSEKAKLAGSILLTLPGMSWVYYGEEIGMEGQGPDEQKREPISWGDDFTSKWEVVKYNKDIAPVNEQIENESSIYNTYKELIQIKKENKVLFNGTFEGIETDNKQLAYRVYDENTSLVIVHNISNTDITLEKNSKVVYTSGYDNGKLSPYKTVIFEEK